MIELIVSFGNEEVYRIPQSFMGQWTLEDLLDEILKEQQRRSADSTKPVGLDNFEIVFK